MTGNGSKCLAVRVLTFSYFKDGVESSMFCNYSTHGPLEREDWGD